MSADPRSEEQAGEIAVVVFAEIHSIKVPCGCHSPQPIHRSAWKRNSANFSCFRSSRKYIDLLV
jgi:hypothetical protein